MKDFIKRNLSIYISIMILLNPIIDVFTGINRHLLNVNLSIGIIIRILFLISIVLISVFIYDKKKLLFPYLIMLIFSILFVVDIYIFNRSILFESIQSATKIFFFPVLLLTLFPIREEFKISNMTLFSTLILYLLLIFIPDLLHLGYDSYEIAKKGYLGFFNSANEVSGIISILTPIMFIIFSKSKNYILSVLLGLLYIIVILSIGTKTPILVLGITLFITFIYLLINLHRKKKYKSIIISYLLLIIFISGSIFIIPKTNFYKNIKIHLNYLKVDELSDFTDNPEYIDHFVFSSRLKFLKNRYNTYKEYPLYVKLLGSGTNKKEIKDVEIDYFDILFEVGIIGFIIVFSIVLYVLINLLKEFRIKGYNELMYLLSILFIFLLSLLTGHIILSPAVSTVVTILLFNMTKRNKKDLLFALVDSKDYIMKLLNDLDKTKYNITILTNKKSTLNSNIILRQLRDANKRSKFIGTICNFINIINYKIINYDNYDYSFSYNSKFNNKLALISSFNNTIYISENEINKDINQFDNIIITKEEIKELLLKKYPETDNKIIFIKSKSKKITLESIKMAINN